MWGKLKIYPSHCLIHWKTLSYLHQSVRITMSDTWERYKHLAGKTDENAVKNLQSLHSEVIENRSPFWSRITYRTDLIRTNFIFKNVFLVSCYFYFCSLVWIFFLCSKGVPNAKSYLYQCKMKSFYSWLRLLTKQIEKYHLIMNCFAQISDKRKRKEMHLFDSFFLPRETNV